MTAMLLMIAAELLAGWLGYQVGIERGMDKERTKRGIRRAQWKL